MKHIDDLNEGIKYSRYGHLSPIDKSFVSLVEVELSPVERHLIPSQLQKDIDHQFQLIGSSFGFQTESIKNMKEFFCSLVLSRLPRYAHCTDCLDSLFEDVLGKKSNFRIWSEQSGYGIAEVNVDMDKKLECLIKYYLIWGEAANLRFCPELICFITALALQADPPEWIPGDFLERIVVPLYSFLRDELYKLKDGYWVRKNRDHSEIVGYDDVNEAFWLMKNIEQLKTTSGKFVMKEPEKTRFQLLSEVEWKSFLSIRKSFFEKRNGYHVIVNFIRIWLIHLFFFFYMTMASGYSLFDDPVIVISLGGLLMSAVATISLLFEASFLPYGEIYRTILPSFLMGLFVSLLCAAAPASCLLLNLDEKLRVIVSWAGAAIGFIVSLLVAFVFPRFRRAQKPLQLRASFHRLIGERKLFSLSFWVIIFALKLAVSFLYLISPFVQLLGSLKPLNIALLQEDVVTEGFRLFVVTSFVALNFVLFLLDTYIWFIIVMSLSGMMHSLFSGISAFRTQVFMNLPQRIKTKLRVGKI
jgi:1,3-beta-glucan synthase